METFEKALWGALIETGHGDILADALAEVGVGTGREHTLDGALHDFLSPGRPFNHEMVRMLTGGFVAYRPFFRDPGKIMIHTLDCGVEGDEYRFASSYTYPLPEGALVSETVEGAIIPYAASCLFFGKIVEAGAPFVFVLTHIPLVGGVAGEGSGALLVGAQGTTPSAYPICIRRIVGPRPETGVFSRDEFQATDPVASVVMPIMERGYTSWR